MKRLGNIYDYFSSEENINIAFDKAKKGKNHYKEVQKIEKYREKYVNDLQKLLKSESFSDFAEEPEHLEGNKIRIDEILNKQLTVINFRVSESKFSKNNNGKYITIQVEIENQNKVIFTGSAILTKQCEKYKNHMPFNAQIIRQNNYYTFK